MTMCTTKTRPDREAHHADKQEGKLPRDARTRTHRAPVQVVTDRSCAVWVSHGFALHETVERNVEMSWITFWATAPFGIGGAAGIGDTNTREKPQLGHGFP